MEAATSHVFAVYAKAHQREEWARMPGVSCWSGEWQRLKSEVGNMRISQRKLVRRPFFVPGLGIFAAAAQPTDKREMAVSLNVPFFHSTATTTGC